MMIMTSITWQTWGLVSMKQEYGDLGVLSIIDSNIFLLCSRIKMFVCFVHKMNR
jgi:hypothetical protein